MSNKNITHFQNNYKIKSFGKIFPKLTQNFTRTIILILNSKNYQKTLEKHPKKLYNNNAK